MKKPKYTRQTNYHLPKTYVVDKTTIREFEESIARQTGARQRNIDLLKQLMLRTKEVLDEERNKA